MHFWLSLVFLGVYFALTQAECNVCSADTDIACVSDTQFQFCSNGFPSGNKYYCPGGSFCTSQSKICQPTSSDVLKDCSSCNECSADLTFACTGPSTFALCLGTNTISNITGTCAPYYVCNVNIKEICGSPTLGIPATCSFNEATTTSSTVSTSTTTTASTLDPTSFCRVTKKSGRYPYGITLTSTCKQYINCYLLLGNWYGAIYTCPGTTYFDSSSAMCTTTIPSRCSGQVQSLELQHILLD